MTQPDTLAEVAGRWPEILAAIGGVSPDLFASRGSKEHPCPACLALTGDAGQTRFRWIGDGRNGAGHWHCSHCGGNDGRGGAGTGLDLLSRIRLGRWGPDAMGPTLALVEEEFLRRSPVRTGRRASRRAKAAPPSALPTQRRTPPPASEWIAFCRLDAADQVADGELFSPDRARGGSYSRRWTNWCETADGDLIASVIAEADTVAGDRQLPDLDEPPPPPEPALPPGPLTRGQVRDQLAQAVADGMARSALESLLLELADRSDTTTTNLRGLLRSLEQEQDAAQAVQAEHQRLIDVAEAQQIGRCLITLDRLFPSSVAGAIRTLVGHLPADEITCSAVFLTAASGVMRLGTELVASRVCNFRVPLNLYAALVGRSGSKKGPIWTLLAVLPLAPIEEELLRRHNAAMEAWRRDCQGKKPHERTDPPRAIRLGISEFTGEGLSLQLQRQEEEGAPLIVLRDEIKGLFAGMNKYSGGRGDDEQRLLEMYDGGGSSSLRVGADGGGRFFRRCHFSVFGTIQPPVLERLVSDGDPGGIWARFLFLPMADRVVPLPATETEEDALAVEQAVKKLQVTIQSLHRLPRLSLALDPQARAAFVAYELRCQHDSKRAPVPAQGAAWSKAPGKALRVAGLLHLIHRVSPDGRVGDLVGAETVQGACDLVDHLTEWSLGIHQAAADGGGASDLMRRIHGLSVAAGGAVGWSEVLRSLPRRVRAEVDSAAALAAVGALVRMGMGEQGEGRRPGSWTYRATGDLPA